MCFAFEGLWLESGIRSKMCGIAALVAANLESSLSVSEMLNTIRHRGPDDEGWTAFQGVDFATSCGGGEDTPVECYTAALSYAPVMNACIPINARIVLGHRRLSITDTSPSGHQPMSYQNNRFWIVLNGEIYNHCELRAELELLGHNFKSRSDTEVLLAAYAQWGQECLGRLEGMFAFVMVDRVQLTLFAARDRFGIKPIYYWVREDQLIAIASEIKQFGVLPGWKAILNPQRGYDFLAFGLQDHTDETMFSGVFQLRPGTCLTLDLVQKHKFKPFSRLETHQWYKLEPKKCNDGFHDASAKYREIYEASIRKHARADVTIGSCLSGGLDSSSIVCTANHLTSEDARSSIFNTYSSCSSNPRYDERKYVEALQDETCINAHFIYPNLNNLLDELDKLTYYQDEPFGSTSIYAQWSVFNVARQHGIKVMLDGQGADEQLAGYKGFHGVLFGQLFRRFQWIELLCEMSATHRVTGMSWVECFGYLADQILPKAIRKHLRALIGKDTEDPSWLNHTKLLKKISNESSCNTTKARSINEFSYHQITAHGLQMLLHWEDRNSMAHSIEARVPFLDHKLVEFILGLPSQYKLYRGVTKRILREAMRGVLPEIVRRRGDKMGFVTPEEVWMQDEQTEKIRQALKQAITSSNGIIRPNILEAFDDMIQGKQSFNFTFWRIISFSAWVRCFNVRID